MHFFWCTLYIYNLLARYQHLPFKMYSLGINIYNYEFTIYSLGINIYNYMIYSLGINIYNYTFTIYLLGINIYHLPFTPWVSTSKICNILARFNIYNQQFNFTIQFFTILSVYFQLIFQFILLMPSFLRRIQVP